MNQPTQEPLFAEERPAAVPTPGRASFLQGMFERWLYGDKTAPAGSKAEIRKLVRRTLEDLGRIP